MELHQLRYFAAITATGSFTAAAALLHVSQSGVSTQLAKLERELGQDLFIRDRALKLTPAGQAVLPMARQVLSTIEAIELVATEFADALRGPVRLGTIPGCTIPGFLDVVADLGRTRPGITLHLSEGTAAELAREVLDRALDIAIIGAAGAAEPALTRHMITEDDLYAIATPDVDLGARPRLAEIQKHRVLCLAAGSGVRAAYDQSCAQLGLEPRVDIEASSPPTLLGLAQRSGGVAVLPAGISLPAGLVAARIKDAKVRARLDLISHPEQRSPAVRLVREQLGAALEPA